MANNEVFLWKNRNSSTHPFLTPVLASEGDFEVYIIRAPYNNDLFNAPTCPEGTVVDSAADTDCALMHTFVAVVPSKEISENTVGVPNYGLAYAQDTVCPECNGESCVCDALLIDISFSGKLHDKEPLEVSIPTYLKLQTAAVQGFNFLKKSLGSMYKPAHTRTMG